MSDAGLKVLGQRLLGRSIAAQDVGALPGTVAPRSGFNASLDAEGEQNYLNAGGIEEIAAVFAGSSSAHGGERARCSTSVPRRRAV